MKNFSKIFIQSKVIAQSKFVTESLKNNKKEPFFIDNQSEILAVSFNWINIL